MFSRAAGAGEEAKGEKLQTPVFPRSTSVSLPVRNVLVIPGGKERTGSAGEGGKRRGEGRRSEGEGEGGKEDGEGEGWKERRQAQAEAVTRAMQRLDVGKDGRAAEVAATPRRAATPPSPTPAPLLQEERLLRLSRQQKRQRMLQRAAAALPTCKHSPTFTPLPLPACRKSVRSAYPASRSANACFCEQPPRPLTPPLPALSFPLQEERSLRLSRQQKRQRMLQRAAAALPTCKQTPPLSPPPRIFTPLPLPPCRKSEERSLRLSRQQKRQRMLQRAAAALPQLAQRVSETPRFRLDDFLAALDSLAALRGKLRAALEAQQREEEDEEAERREEERRRGDSGEERRDGEEMRANLWTFQRSNPPCTLRISQLVLLVQLLVVLVQGQQGEQGERPRFAHVEHRHHPHHHPFHLHSQTSSSSLTPPNIFLSYPSPSPPSSPFSKPLDLPTLKSALHALNFATAAAAGAASEAAGGAGAGAAGGAPSLRARRATGVTPITTRFTRTSSDFSLSAFLPPVSPPFPVQCSKPLDLATLKSALHAQNFATAAAAGAAGTGAAGGAPSLRARRATGIAPITTRFTRTSSDFSLAALTPPPKPLPLLSFPTLPLPSPSFPLFPVQQATGPSNTKTLSSSSSSASSTGFLSQDQSGHLSAAAAAAAAAAVGGGASGGLWPMHSGPLPSTAASNSPYASPYTSGYIPHNAYAYNAVGSSSFSASPSSSSASPYARPTPPRITIPIHPDEDDAESDANDLPNLTPGSAARSGGAKPVNHPGQEARSSTATSIVALHTHHPRHALSSHASARPPIRLASFLSSVFRSAARGPSIASGTACLDLKERSVAELEAMPWSQLEPTIKTWLRDANILIRVLLEGERLLCEAVLEDAPELDAGGVYRQLLSASLCVEGSVGKLAGTARSIAGLTRSPEKVFSFMEMFRAATGLREQVQSVLIAAAGVGGGSLWPQWQALPALLACAVFETIDELNSTLRHVDGLTPAAMPSPVAPKKKLLSRIISWKAQEVKSQSGEDVDVSVHAVTSYVVNYIGQLLDRTSRANYCAVLEEIYQSHGADHLKEPSSSSNCCPPFPFCPSHLPCRASRANYCAVTSRANYCAVLEEIYQSHGGNTFQSPLIPPLFFHPFLSILLIPSPRTSRANYCAVLEEIYQSHGADHLKEPSSNSSSSSQHPGHAPQTPVQGAAGTPKEAAPLQYAAPAAAAAAAVATPDVPSNFPTALESAPAAAAPAAATAAAAAAAAGTPKEKARDSQNALGGGGGSSGGGSTSGGRKGRGVGGRQRKRQLGADMEALLDALYFNMEARGRTIADGPLSALFVLNNANYIASSISSGRMRDAIRHSDRLADYESAFERAALCKVCDCSPPLRHSDRLVDYESAFERAALCKTTMQSAGVLGATLLACLEPLEVSAKMSGDGVKQRQIWLYACKNVIVSPSTSLIHPLAHLSESPSTFRLPKPRGLKRFNAVFDEEVALEQRLRLELLCLHAPIDASLHNHIYACSTIPCSLKRFNAVFEEVALEQRRWLVLSDSCRKAMRVRFAKVIKGSYMDFLTPHR
ncbi:unnamed protein product [Closterium sp. NIES-64]|nr:unnamed protein product [Closterium sp. NIES-64]